MLFKVIASIVILGLVVLNILYKLEIKKIGEQVDFINRHESNKMIGQSIKFKEINILVHELNNMISTHRTMKRDYKMKDEALKEAITNISHDIRTPLTSLSGYFQLLIESESREEKERYMNIIQIRIDNLKNLLEDMFTYIKIQDDKYELQAEDCNISKIVQESLLSHYESFNERKIEPRINISGKPIIIRGNAIGLARIINNLIHNSLSHGESYIGIDLFEKDKMVCLIVENDVKYPEAIDLDNVFTRFYKKDEARTITSTGLGLTIVKELVEAMDGEISASIEEDIFLIKISL